MDWPNLLRTAILKAVDSGKSIYAIAKESGVPQPTVHRIAYDGAEPKLGTAEKIAAVVGLVLRKR